MSKLLVKEIPRDKLKEYKDYIGFLFLNEDSVYNICTNEEDIIKSNQWFNNRPVEVYSVAEEGMGVGKHFIPFCTNREMNGKILTYLGPHKEGVDLIDIMGEDGEEFTSTIHLLKDIVCVERPATLEEKQEIVNGRKPYYYV